MTEPREAVEAPAISGRCSHHPTTEEIETFWHDGVDALPHSTLNDELRGAVALCPPSLKRLVDGEPPAPMEDRWLADPDFPERRIDLEITPAGVIALSELAQADQTAHKREQLMTSLMFAARNLAQSRILHRHTICEGSSLYCGECQAHVESDPLRNAGEHARSCNTGLVLVVLAELAKLPKAAVVEIGGAA